MSKIDLHIHTNMSDGDLKPFEVIDEAKKSKVNTIAIADHDTVSAYTLDVFNYTRKNDIRLIPAVEISTKTDRCGIHVLGYNIDISNKELNSELNDLKNARHDYLYNVSIKLESLGYKVNLKELDKISSVTKAHIALDIINNDENKDILLKNFGTIPNMGKFIETVMNENCPAYVEKKTITPKKAADLIRKAGGKVVLAHPVSYIYEDSLTESDILNLVKWMKPDGIEAIYIYVDKDGNVINEISKWENFAIKNGLFVTCGSDFHRIDGLHPEIGFKNEDIHIDDASIEKMLKSILD